MVGHMSRIRTATWPALGTPIHLCGGSDRLTTYYWTGTPLHVWNTPANTGYYELLIGGLVVPLIATVGINNKVSFVEKWGTSEFTNSTGAYELDLSLVDNYLLAWREMHVKTDVFCSASIILPDKGARQINLGGWSLTSTYGVRLYYPDGSPGVNGTHDWEENVNELSLQRGRWYPTAMMMPNGSILVVGGETGSNGPPQPSLEILPKPPGNDTTITLDYLQRTDPNNLYPFLLVLPSGRIFIGYYNEARILDPVTFDTVTVLPNMPGAVNNFLAGRTYPMEGTAVLLPQYAPYTDPIEILVCGGSTPGAGIALDNCITIAPEAENATWVLERMPSKRVMPCMVTLPDGTYMIMNGGQQGFAGFGLGNDPNLNALLYDPSQPVGQRISILNNTIVARLYHSEATLLPDGRVLVSGSDPETYYANGSYVYPEEFRIEVYIPPYLNQGFTQPTFTIAETDWNLGGQYTIEVTLFQGTTNTMRISLIAASSSTHGNVMSGGRILFPEFSCSGNTCTITAPPNVYGPATTPAPNKLAMSRALGAAFLSHQVEQLEKTVTRGPASGNWRDRRQPQADLGAHPNQNRRTTTVTHGPKQRSPSVQKQTKKEHTDRERDHTEQRHRDKPRRSSDGVADKDADLVVVDASVLVHALHQVKKWCREGREEIVIVPLEALNTLDLLKKGTSPVAQRARAASRILEAKVGTNPRIRVQRDDAFVPWDKIGFKDPVTDDDKDKPAAQALHLSGSPEWVRRMICCARWEIDHALSTLDKPALKDPKVVLAVLSHTSAQAQVDRAAPESTSELSSPVPLPAPSPHSHRYEPRSAGILIGHWATRAGIPILEFNSTPMQSAAPAQHRGAEDDERGKRPPGRGRINSHSGSGPPTRGTGLVERPPAVMQMMEVVAQPSKVVRVLARGEKLEPDP
ncbi:hypothetical protein JVU11DRAFT_7102 [Chiua virens]|nr:hypothetical protein JVU11DRAFT_7102 [Chiua virens]